MADSSIHPSIQGGGGNAVNRMVETQILDVEFWSVNTDSQALTKALSRNTLNVSQSVRQSVRQ